MLVFNAFYVFQNMLFSDVLSEILGGQQEHQFKCYLKTGTVQKRCSRCQDEPVMGKMSEKIPKALRTFPQGKAPGAFPKEF